jgi:hypothetical protein
VRTSALATFVATALAGAYVLAPEHDRPRAAAASHPPPLVPCEYVVLRPRSAPPGTRIVFGRIAFVGARVYQVADVGGDGSLRLFAKIGLYVRAGTPTFTLALPQRWRSRAGIAWGTGIEQAARIAACPSRPRVWNGYAGGIYVRERACVPLVVRLGHRRALLRFGLGGPCPGDPLEHRVMESPS